MAQRIPPAIVPPLMSEPSTSSRPHADGPRHNPRMHQGGKLSFRARLKDEAPDPGDRLVLGGDDPPGLFDLVPTGYRDVEIEIGPGKGSFVLASAEARPDVFLLGIEAAPGYAAHAAARLLAGGWANALLLQDNGKLYLEDRVPAASLAAVHVYFPDPWPKRRHAGRRFFTDDAPATVAHALRDGGILYVATDNAAYAGQVCRTVGSSEWFRRDDETRDRALAAGPGHAFTPTNFERKYIEQGRVIRRYAFRRLPRAVGTE
jgi:tRNA (guanine-N7-)-methyltransferase